MKMAASGTPDGKGETLDWTVDGRPGVKVDLGREYAIAQVLDNGFTVAWTTDDSALDAVRKCAVLDDPITTATVRYDDNAQTTVAGPEIVPFLQKHDCWWVKLTRADVADYVVFIAGPTGSPSELATLGPPLETSGTSDQGEKPPKDRIWHIKAMMNRTATPALRDRLETLLPDLIGTVRT